MKMTLREKLKRFFSRSPPQPSSHPPQNQTKAALAVANSHTPNITTKNEPSPTTHVVPTIPTGMKAKPLGKRASKKQQKEQAANGGKPKIELYKPHKVPPSKYRGPFNQEHLDSLAAYTLLGAMADVRPRSMLSELSPMGTRAPPTRRGSATSDIVDNGELSIDATLMLGEANNNESNVDDNDNDNTRTEIQTDETRYDSSAHPQPIPESEGDSDATSVTAVGIEDVNSPQVQHHARLKNPVFLSTKTSRTTTAVPPGKVSSTETLVPFTPADLTSALSAIQIRSS